MTTQSQPKLRTIRTITLTDRAPVRIDEKKWPIISQSRRHDGQIRSQANRVWHLTVRRHIGGVRMIVYGSEDSGSGGEPRGYEAAYAGEIVDDAERVVEAIRRVGLLARCSEAMIQECIAGLPAEDLTHDSIST
jgi:hypothetical protein